jgi:hypothetical protein
MIQSEKLGRIFYAAILTGKTISNIDVFSAKANGAMGAWPHIATKAQDAWELKARTGRAGKDRMILQDVDFALKPQDECPSAS